MADSTSSNKHQVIYLYHSHMRSSCPMFKKQNGVVDQMETIKLFAAQKNKKNFMILYEFVLFLLNAP